MIKKISVLVLIISVSLLISSESYSQTQLPLMPDMKLSVTKDMAMFKQKYDVICIALLIYRLDAVERASKEVVKDTMMKKYDTALLNFSGVHFDLDKIDVGRKGFTRYYPFYVSDSSYVIRIFKTEERAYQPEMDILYEGLVDNPDVTFQIVPGINAMLKDTDIKPASIGTFVNPAQTCP